MLPGSKISVLLLRLVMQDAMRVVFKVQREVRNIAYKKFHA